MVEVVAGALAVAVAFLSLVAGVIALHTFTLVKDEDRLRPWKVLMAVLLLFMAEEIFGALKFFSIYTHPYITHIIPTAMLGLLLYALILEIIMVKTNDHQ